MILNRSKQPVQVALCLTPMLSDMPRRVAVRGGRSSPLSCAADQENHSKHYSNFANIILILFYGI